VRTITVFALFALALLGTSAPVNGRPSLELRARPAFSFAPADLKLEFLIAPDGENAALDVIAESEAFYRGSRIELEGERAPRVLSIHYQSMPAGEYSVRGVLLDRGGHERVMVEKQITVMSSGER
jgi:hypothetical protein